MLGEGGGKFAASLNSPSLMVNIDKARKREWQRTRRRRAVEEREHCCAKCNYAFEGSFYLRRHEKSCLQRQDTAETSSLVSISIVKGDARQDDVEIRGQLFWDSVDEAELGEAFRQENA